MWTGIQTPASPIGATAEKLVTRSNDSWSKSSEEVRASNIFLVSDVSFLRHVWFVCGRLWEKSDACSLLFYRNKTRRERFFLPNLRHHNHQRLPSATIRKRKENGARLFTFWHRIKKNYRSGGNVCVCVSREIKIKKPPKNAFKLFRAACAYFILPFDGSSLCGTQKWRWTELKGGEDGPVGQSQEIEIYERIGWKWWQIYKIQKSDEMRGPQNVASTLTLFYYELPFDGRYRELSWAPAEYGRRNYKRVTVGAISIVRIPNVHRTSQINSAPGKMYAQLWPWHTKGEFKRLWVYGPPGVVCRQWPLKKKRKKFFFDSHRSATSNQYETWVQCKKHFENPCLTTTNLTR